MPYFRQSFIRNYSDLHSQTTDYVFLTAKKEMRKTLLQLTQLKELLLSQTILDFKALLSTTHSDI